MQFIMPCPERDKGIVRPAEFPHHVSEGEDCAEDEFGVVFGGEGVVSFGGGGGGGGEVLRLWVKGI